MVVEILRSAHMNTRTPPITLKQETTTHRNPIGHLDQNIHSHDPLYLGRTLDLLVFVRIIIPRPLDAY